ncbi:MAG: class I SAM-dependent methyltransferase [Taibaiella sp.]|nr:class I SAM-dependent methyltransferase [Taibaiella sp.]
MIEDVKKSYTDFHLKKKSSHLYPTEWVIRTMLGNYPGLSLDRSKYQGGKGLDLGFGDGRNMSLLHNCGMEVYGVETTQETVDLVRESLASININATLKVGSNNNIPFEDNFFDYILASASCYYIDKNGTFDDNLNEIVRVLKPGGYFIANFPAFTDIKGIPVNFILERAIPTDDGHVIIQNDVFGIRNGYKFKAFYSQEELKNTLSEKFEDISIGYCFDDFYGLQHNLYISSSKKK